MVQTDQWRIADEQLHGAGYKTIVCCPENALTGAPAQNEGLIVVPFPHVLRRAFGWFSSSNTTAGGDAFAIQKAIPPAAFVTLTGLHVLVAGSINANIVELSTTGVIPQEEESGDLGAVYRLTFDISDGANTFNDVGFGIMISAIPPGPYEHRQ